MKTIHPSRVFVLLSAVALLLASAGHARDDADILYIGDNSSNTVRRFNADTGQPLASPDAGGIYALPSAGGLMGPRGIVAFANKLFVVNQNVNTPFNGEILSYRLNSGSVTRPTLPASNAHAPFVPRGMVYSRGTFYLADFTADGGGAPGKLLAFDGARGTFLREFAPPAGFAHQFYPRGVVIGPNGLLYVANVPTFPPGDGGEVLVFHPKTLHFVGSFVSDAGGAGQLNRPEGLVFGPDGNLYVTSFASNGTSDTDSIRIYDGATGVFLDRIELGVTNGPRAFAQALLFGPEGRLFVPITGNDPGMTGQVRRYDVATKQYDVIIPTGGAGQPWYLTFGNTDPGTLEYTRCK